MRTDSNREQVGAFDPDKLSSCSLIGVSFLSGRMAYCVLG
jgi:hypothetical protein